MKHISEYKDKISALEEELDALRKRARTLQEKYKAAQELCDEATEELEQNRSGGFAKGPFKFGKIEAVDLPKARLNLTD